MADRRRRKVGQIWRCNNNEFGFRRGDEVQILNIEVNQNYWGSNIFHVQLLNRDFRNGERIVRMDANRLTSRDDRWIFVREDAVGEIPTRPFILVCVRCRGRDIIEAQFAPTNRRRVCETCQQQNGNTPTLADIVTNF